MRPFRLGVTRWPPDLTLDAVAQTEAFIRTNCDMAAPMFIGGVPWTEALTGAEFSPNLRRELAYRPPSGHELLVSIGALDNGRSKLAPYWGEKDNLPLPASFRDLPFDAPQIKEAYANFALRVIKAMHPDWFAIGIEPNVMLSKDAKAWPAYKALHRHVGQWVSDSPFAAVQVSRTPPPQNSPLALLGGVGEAPMQEIAGSWGKAVPPEPMGI